MKTINFLCILFFLSSCITAQNFKLIKASHTTSHGGVIGARAEKFEIVIKENPQLLLKYLLVGNVKIELLKKTDGGTIQLNGTYFPEKQPSVTLNGENPNSRNDFNLNEAFLIYENINSKKEQSQKIIFSPNSKIDDAIPTDDVPE